MAQTETWDGPWLQMHSLSMRECRTQSHVIHDVLMGLHKHNSRCCSKPLSRVGHRRVDSWNQFSINLLVAFMIITNTVIITIIGQIGSDWHVRI